MVASSAVYTDIQGLANLRNKAHRDPKGNLREAAKQFEAIFIQNMLKNARSASLAQGALDGPHSDTYREMYDQQLALTLANGKGIGISEMLVRHLDKSMPTAESATTTADASTNKTNWALKRALSKISSLTENINEIASKPADLAPQTDPKDYTPKTFVAEVWQAARSAAQELGVDPKVLIAQAALESGWGRSVGKLPDGRSSYNLFGIKADSSWKGERFSVSTLEYEKGVAVRRRDPFRAYNSFAESFSDYVQFLRSNPRYQIALKQVNNPEAFLTNLQKAGYASDPSYARKVSAIFNGNILRTALN